ncbi:DUF2892 domain-containing protein [Yoonia sp. BS5-3]|uniref:DUF2892 domain-containing protein n=1 Tax=Yoonia phaeophyticola TaxID=3137369 RepID=A0ABZ2V860_9RHOB
MTRNLAYWDRIARFVLGMLPVIAALTGTIGVWGWVGVILLTTASVNFCPPPFIGYLPVVTDRRPPWCTRSFK